MVWEGEDEAIATSASAPDIIDAEWWEDGHTHLCHLSRIALISFLAENLESHIMLDLFHYRIQSPGLSGLSATLRT
jgi:hypothetical protein